MRRLIVVFVLLLSANYLWGQYPSIYKDTSKHRDLDSALYCVTYKVGLTLDPQKGKKSEDLIMLQIGTRASATYSIPLLNAAETAQKLIAKGAKAVPMHQLVTLPEDIYKFLSSGQLQSLYRTYGLGPHYLYEEPLPKFNWELIAEYKEILGYPVQKAICSYRGRKYIAWFSKEIPFSDGPWKFWGLPGLILEVSDTEQQFTFSSVAIKRAPSGTAVRQWKWESTKISRDKLRKTIKYMHAQPHLFLEATTGFGIISLDKSDPKKVSHPYNPIELE